ncbi:MAG: hypothetical protein WCG85_06115 [Polyangia bacterium]
MKIHVELRGLRPNTVSPDAFSPTPTKRPLMPRPPISSFLLGLVRNGRSPRTRNMNLAAVRCLLGATTGSNATAGIPPRRPCDRLVLRPRKGKP